MDASTEFTRNRSVGAAPIAVRLVVGAARVCATVMSDWVEKVLAAGLDISRRSTEGFRPADEAGASWGHRGDAERCARTTRRQWSRPPQRAAPPAMPPPPRRLTTCSYGCSRPSKPTSTRRLRSLWRRSPTITSTATVQSTEASWRGRPQQQRCSSAGARQRDISRCGKPAGKTAVT